MFCSIGCTHSGGSSSGVGLETGTYTGDGTDDRNINIGIDLASKTHCYVMVVGNTANSKAHRIEYGQGDLTMRYDSAVDYANGIQGFTATGFQVGSTQAVNGSGNVYRYIAIWKD